MANDALRRVTPLAALLGLDVPVIQAPMAGVQDAGLAIAVCHAGGLGSLPCAMLSADAMRREIGAVVGATSRPFNVNFFCHTPPAPDPVRDASWREALRPYYEEFGLDASEVPSGPARMPFSHEAADVLEELKPPVVSFHFGLPSPELMNRVRATGAKILASATTVDEARWLEARGVDAIVAQGLEAGGHRGMFLSPDLTNQVETSTLVQAMVKAVRIPVIAAGGIADANGIKTAIARGAAGVQIGTAYLLCSEATTSAVHRAALASERATATHLTNLFTGGVARGIVNRLMRELGPINPLAPPFPLAAAAVAPLRAKAEAANRDDFSPLWAGQNVSGCRPISATDLTRALVNDE